MQSTQDLTRRERKKKLTRETLTAVALNIISKQGIYVTTIEDVTNKADIGKGTFYQHFSSKEELLETLLKDGLDKLLAACELSSQRNGNLENRLRALVKAHVKFLMKEESFVLVFHQVRGMLQLKQGVSANLREIYGDYLLGLAELIKKPAKSAAISRTKARELAMSLASYSTGLINHYRLFHKKMSLPIESEQIEKRILAALI